MKKLFLLTLLQYLIINIGNAQTFQVDTVQYKGDINKFINIVIMGDGYTNTQQSDFLLAANNITNYLFTQPPFSNYIDYFNVFAIKVISNQSGAEHPGNAADCSSASPIVPISSPNTHLGCTFDVFGIHRLIVPNNATNIANVLSTNFPSYDQVIIIANTPYYGGSGGSYATITTHPNSLDVCVHELGHSFAQLKDEYYAGDMYANESPNMTQETDATLVKWTNWMGTNGVGIYQHCCGGQSAFWYRPHNNCKMKVLGVPFCSVCSEQIIENIHSRVNTIVSYTPTTLSVSSPNQFLNFKLTELMTPAPNTLNIDWKLDGSNISSNVDSVILNQNNLSIGVHYLLASVIDTTAMVRINNHSTIHFNSIVWTINKTSTGIELLSDLNNIKYAVFPNPVNSTLNLSVESDKSIGNLNIQIYSLDGKLVQELLSEPTTNGKYFNNVNVDNLSSGTYFILFKNKFTNHKVSFVKQ